MIPKWTVASWGLAVCVSSLSSGHFWSSPETFKNVQYFCCSQNSSFSLLLTLAKELPTKNTGSPWLMSVPLLTVPCSIIVTLKYVTYDWSHLQLLQHPLKFGCLVSRMYLSWLQHPRVTWSPFSNFPSGFWQAKKLDSLIYYVIHLMTMAERVIKLGATQWLHCSIDRIDMQQLTLLHWQKFEFKFF